MKHIEELKIGVTAVLFCLVMLLVYAVFPQDGFVPTRKAPMPEIPTSDSWSEEEDYGFQIYTQESNYDDSYSDSSSGQEDSYDDSYQEETDTSVPAETDTSVPAETDTDSGADTSQETVPDTGTTDEPAASEDTSDGDSYVEEPSVDESYDADTGGEASGDEFNWNETEETYNFEE